MTRREKTLTISAGSILALLMAYLLARQLVLAPARSYADQARTLKTSNAQLTLENRRLERCREDFARLRDETFDDNPLRASVLVSSRISRLARQAGLNQSDFTVSPFTRGGRRDVFSEVGCNVRGTSSLERLTNLLYLLQQDPYQHRISSLDVTPRPDKRAFTFALRYTAPVFDRPPPVKIRPRRRSATQPAALASLNDSARAAYDAIQKRDPFKPYVRRPAVARRPPPPPRPPSRRTHRPPPSRPRPMTTSYDRLVVTGLPSSNGKAEVHLANPGRDAEKIHKIGDKLPVGQIAMVDYRVLPMPKNPKILSTSRVILKLSKDYWAVELGQQLSQRRVLRPHELPTELKPKPAATQPAEKK